MFSAIAAYQISSKGSFYNISLMCTSDPGWTMNCLFWTFVFLKMEVNSCSSSEYSLTYRWMLLRIDWYSFIDGVVFVYLENVGPWSWIENSSFTYGQVAACLFHFGTTQGLRFPNSDFWLRLCRARITEIWSKYSRNWVEPNPASSSPPPCTIDPTTRSPSHATGCCFLVLARSDSRPESRATC